MEIEIQLTSHISRSRFRGKPRNSFIADLQITKEEER